MSTNSVFPQREGRLRRLAAAFTGVNVGALMQNRVLRHVEYLDVSGNKFEKGAVDHIAAVAHEMTSLRVYFATNFASTNFKR